MQEEKPLRTERQPTTQQWSQLCMKSLKDHLAPKGFSEIKAGVFKGKFKANIEFLEDKQVHVAGQIASGCVNHFRKRLKEMMNERLKESEAKSNDLADQLSKTKFWEFEKKKVLKRGIMSLNGQIGVTQIFINEIDYITIQ